MIKIVNRIAQFDSTNLFGIKTAFATFMAILLIMIGYITTQADFFTIIGIVAIFILVILNSIVICSVFINFLIRFNRLIESLFTLYLILLNIPFFIGFVLLNNHLTGKHIL